MGGIGDYFHGEEGNATGLLWVIYKDDNNLSFVMSLEGDPHRVRAQDYGSDIGIDPLITKGDRVIYVRLDPYCGIWVKTGNQFIPEVKAALARVQENRKRCFKYMDLYAKSRILARLWARRLPRETGVPLKLVHPGETLFDRASLPATEATIFLSYSGRNALIARVLYECLKTDGKVQVWFDLAQPGESARHDASVSDWLRKAVFQCQIFVVLLTRASVASGWVQKEIDWGAEKAKQDQNFHLILLNLEGVATPKLSGVQQSIIDCKGFQIREITEELYAAVYRRTGRRAWVVKQKNQGWQERKPQEPGYQHLMSDGGTAIALHWIEDGDSFRWILEYESGGTNKQVAGRGPYQVVDVSICPGDQIAGSNYGHYRPFWMRSNDLKLSTGDVLTKYWQKVGDPGKWFLSHKL